MRLFTRYLPPVPCSPMSISPVSRLAATGFALVLLASSALSHEARSPCGSSAKKIPQRSASAWGARAFLDAIARMNEPERDRAIRGELMAGNFPAFLRKIQPVTLNARTADGAAVRLTLCVMADYLSIGSDEDFVRVPMGLPTALSVAARLGFTLPTRSMVNLIYRESAVRLAPQPLPPGDQMRSTDYFRLHNAMVRRQRELNDSPPDALMAGHKKDLVMSTRLWSQPDRVAIYGWHRGPDAPIQPLSTVHGARYADYSHGVRLVSTVVFVNDTPRSIFDVLADQDLAPLLSDEGPLRHFAGFFSPASKVEPGT